jgi:DNA-binding HxlR family transcriptional regulator
MVWLPRMKRTDEPLCPAARAINLLQEKWVLHIVRTLLDGPRGFNDLSRAVGGCNTTTLADRLEELESLGIVRRTVHSLMPPRTSYELTARGIELDEIVQAIDRWARRHLPLDRPPGGHGEARSQGSASGPAGLSARGAAPAGAARALRRRRDGTRQPRMTSRAADEPRRPPGHVSARRAGPTSRGRG